jgi:DNA helicase-2/ATP-dependent DNA helicase PcrA
MTTLQRLSLIEGNPLELAGFDAVQAVLLQWQESPTLAEKTLILVNNTTQQKALQHALIQGWQNPMNRLPVYTFNGLIRHIVQRLWPYAELKLQQAFKSKQHATCLVPELVGLEESERLFRFLIEQTKAQGHFNDAFEALKLDEASLIRQLIRRQRLRAEQRLTRVQIHTMDHALNIPEHALIHHLEHVFEVSALEMRWLDSTKQIDIALALLEEHPEWKEALEVDPELLLWLDADESTPAEQALLRLLGEKSAHVMVSVDPQGGARQGYLNADIEGAKTLIESWQAQAEQTQHLLSPSLQEDPLPPLHVGEALCHAFLGLGHERPLALEPQLVLHPAQRSLIEMWDCACATLNTLPAQDVVLVMPEINALTLAPLTTFLNQQKIFFQVLSGTQRPVDTLQGKLLLLLIQVLHSHEWQLPLSRFEWRTVLSTCLSLQTAEAKTLDAFCDFVTQSAMRRLSEGQTGASSLPLEIPEDLLIYEASRQRYASFCQALFNLGQASIEAQLQAIAHQWIYPKLAEGESDSALQLIYRSWQRQLNMLNALSPDSSHTQEGAKQWLWQSKYGQIADTADAPKSLEAQALIIATPQKVIDFAVRRPVQIWLDVQSPRWSKSDEAPLYHTAVHSPQGWRRLETFAESQAPLEERPPLDVITLTEQQRRKRAGHLLRKLAYGASQRIHVFSAELDAEGREQAQQQPLLFQALTQSLLPLLAEPDLDAIATATLRPDQQGVLTYRTGTLAISAVPGAGKTFVSVELILHLIKTGMPPDSILVLTYMESAARTLLGRLKPKLAGAGIHQLPTVCTIHALAFKILGDASHARRLGLDVEHFRMVDETEQDALQKQAALDVYPLASAESDLTLEAWQRIVSQAINHAKSLELSWADLIEDAKTLKNTRLEAMGLAMKGYQQLLQARNALDFTDLIVYAVQLLEAHDDVRTHFQQQFRVIMEDEAQDSSRLLQRFLNLLGGPTPNLVRCGDTNQSITTTFSAAEPAVFREFITQADAHVRMTHSGRCATEIMHLANRWIQEASQAKSPLKDAFMPVEMQGLSGVNPPLAYPIKARSFTEAQEEDAFVIKEILAVQAKYPQARCAVLWRYNRDVLRFSHQLLERRIATLSLSERLPSVATFKRVEAWLGVLLYSEQAEARLTLLHTLRGVSTHPLHALSEEAFVELRDVLASVPLFALPVEELTTLPTELQQLYYDWHDFQRDLARRDLPSWILRLSQTATMGETQVLERCNGFLCALHAQRILQRYGLGLEHSESQQLSLLAPWQSLSPLEVVFRYFKSLTASRRNLQVFTEELLNPTVKASSPLEEQTPPVHVMTLHKSKGMEFDFVWMPALTQANFPDELAQIRVKDAEKALIGIQRLALQRQQPNTPLLPLNDAITAFQRQHLEEEARLLYVGFTRAMQGLFLSTHTYYRNTFHKRQTTKPTHAFTFLTSTLQ